jgi:hypothetical protein
MPSTNFRSLRSSSQGLLKKLSEQAKSQDQKQGQDERFWKMFIDPKTKLGSAVIRFLPPPKDEDQSWVRVFRHAFQGQGGWFIENCPTTIGRECPVCKDNNELWNSGDESNKAIVSKRKRKLEHISNVYVINDTHKPENNGKVYLFRYGQKIFEKLKDKLDPTDALDAAFNPFDLWEGANFKLRSADQAGYANYDKSAFDAQSELLGGDEAKLEALWLSQHALGEFIADAAFKSWDDLEKKLKAVLYGRARGPKTAEDAIKQEQKAQAPTQEDAAEAAEALAQAEDKPKPSRARTPKATPKAAPAPAVAADDDEDVTAFFAQLGGDDE